MVRPRWQSLQPRSESRFWRRWDQSMALIATANVAWIIFDISYIPLRNFWLHREIYPLPSIPLVVPVSWLPNITPIYDKIKGIEPHRDTQNYINQFRRLENVSHNTGINSPKARQLRLELVVLTSQMIDENPFVSSGNLGTLEKIKNLLRARTGMDSAKQSAAQLLGKTYITDQDWNQEKLFWNQKILPLVATNYWRAIDASGQQVNISWRIDTPFQILFLIDILLRAFRLKTRYPRIRWSDALLRRWIDLPLLLPFWRLLRIVPVTERLSSSRLIQLEPLRAAVSRVIVAVLALELFEVLTVRIVDALQGSIRAPLAAERIRRLRSHQSLDQNDGNELAELIRLWLPVLLSQVGPNMRPQLIGLFSHTLQRSLNGVIVPPPLQSIPAIQKAESELGRQLASGMVDALLDISRTTGDQLGRKDPVLDELGIEVLDRFWEELARTIEEGPILDRSQDLLIAILEDFKRSSFTQLRAQGGVDELITELDGLNFSPSDQQEKD